MRHYLWDGENVLQEQDAALATLAHYTESGAYWGGLASQRRGATSRFYGFDLPGNTRLLADAAGSVTDRYSYTAFGEEREATGTTENPHRYGGQAGYWRDAADRQYVRARHLEVEAGRWLSVDPVEGEPRYL